MLRVPMALVMELGFVLRVSRVAGLGATHIDRGRIGVFVAGAWVGRLANSLFAIFGQFAPSCRALSFASDRYRAFNS